MFGAARIRDVLIQPVQRVPRYELLLKELIKVSGKIAELAPRWVAIHLLNRDFRLRTTYWS